MIQLTSAHSSPPSHHPKCPFLPFLTKQRLSRMHPLSSRLPTTKKQPSRSCCQTARYCHRALTVSVRGKSPIRNGNETIDAASIGLYRSPPSLSDAGRKYMSEAVFVAGEDGASCGAGGERKMTPSEYFSTRLYGRLRFWYG